MTEDFFVVGRAERGDDFWRPFVTLMRGDPSRDDRPRSREALRRRDDLVRIDAPYMWGEYSDGSRALALALLAAATSEKVAKRLYDDMARHWLSALDRDLEWVISRNDLLVWAANWNIEPLPVALEAMDAATD